MKKLIDALLVKLGFKSRTYKFVMADNTEVALEGIHCLQCQNAFWLEHTALEMPTFCCYCGCRFEKIDEVDAGTFKDVRDSTN